MNVVMKNVALSIVLISTLAGCNGGNKAKEASQVAAKVNGDEITVHQLNFALSHLGNLDEAQSKVAMKKVLGSLVDQQLMIQKAIEQKMDRDPQIVQAIEAARDQILAKAYMERKLQSLPKPSSAEIKDYYDKHPELFSDRKIYRLQELRIVPAAEQLKSVKVQVEQARNLQSLSEWLKSEKVPFSGDVAVKAAEQLPLEILPRIHELKEGQVASFPVAGNYLVVSLTGSQPQPLSLDKSQTFIETYLLNQERIHEVQSDMKKLRDGAKIEYLGQFAKSAEQAAPQSKTAVATPKVVAAQQDSNDGSYIRKGISGLK